jgi:hypothetical protein
MQFCRSSCAIRFIGAIEAAGGHLPFFVRPLLRRAANA